ncbi:MAG: transcriptional repressor [Rhodospirillaceae bacterium]|jgi:Fur family transcriptional regulator, ferric uptake regulator|nr:transcriptional repressor [Rhodospirillaceae bacterium]MBT4043211.1 transcriptional repressor [Rhodospirillaceae bacterium]MBT4687615.1 transcriptional repressor [Rhodospirillaceae bacterium]MBT5524767.1 transcriptional repressor [Rhodospirillaceae bacterium]MBT6589241.1 transcriptional repressor [Rhodospirillaceae bacterium]
MPGQIERLCIERGLRMTGQRRVVARVLSEADDHPDAEEVYRRASALEPKISIATVYRTLRILEDAGILQRLEFGDGRARFEQAESDHHDHLIDTSSGRVIEFQNEQLEALQEKVAHELGFRLIGHRMELYGVPLDDATNNDQDADPDSDPERP